MNSFQTAAIRLEILEGNLGIATLDQPGSRANTLGQAILGELEELGRPIVVGASRKSFLGELTGREVGERLGGTVASNVLALRAGADVFRVHDVAELRQALDVAEAILGRRAWETREPSIQA